MAHACSVVGNTLGAQIDEGLPHYRTGGAVLTPASASGSVDANRVRGSMTSRIPVVIFFVVVTAVSLPFDALDSTPTDEMRTRLGRNQHNITAVDARPD